MKTSVLNRYGEMYIENLKETNPKKYNRMKKAGTLVKIAIMKQEQRAEAAQTMMNNGMDFFQAEEVSIAYYILETE